MTEGGANEVWYKIAEFLLKRMHEDKLLTEEEWGKVTAIKVAKAQKHAQEERWLKV